jgi:hypothetical protein
LQIIGPQQPSEQKLCPIGSVTAQPIGYTFGSRDAFGSEGDALHPASAGAPASQA